MSPDSLRSKMPLDPPHAEDYLSNNNDSGEKKAVFMWPKGTCYIVNAEFFKENILPLWWVDHTWVYFFWGDFIYLFFLISLQFYNNCSYRQHPQFLPRLELCGVTLKNIFFYPSERFTKTFHDDRLWYLRVNAIQTTSGFPGVKPMHNERNGKKKQEKTFILAKRFEVTAACCAARKTKVEIRKHVRMSYSRCCFSWTVRMQSFLLPFDFNNYTDTTLKFHRAET